MPEPTISASNMEKPLYSYSPRTPLSVLKQSFELLNKHLESPITQTNEYYKEVAFVNLIQSDIATKAMLYTTRKQDFTSQISSKEFNLDKKYQANAHERVKENLEKLGMPYNVLVTERPNGLVDKMNIAVIEIKTKDINEYTVDNIKSERPTSTFPTDLYELGQSFLKPSVQSESNSKIPSRFGPLTSAFANKAMADLSLKIFDFYKNPASQVSTIQASLNNAYERSGLERVAQHLAHLKIPFRKVEREGKLAEASYEYLVVDIDMMRSAVQDLSKATFRAEPRWRTFLGRLLKH